jgi:shikimate dehydrogenase
MQKRDFDGINVTIPYKQSIMPYLDELDPAAEAIGAVNCIVNREWKMTGYNTDYLGFMQMLQANHVMFKENIQQYARHRRCIQRQ